MMEEVAVMMAYDAQLVEQMSEEEILASLVSETGPTFTVPTKRAKMRDSRLQIMENEDDDPLDKYLKENRELLQTSLRLEQENDNLAHRLITSKVALRKALDKAEDNVDELTKDLLLARHQLTASEEDKRGKVEETAMLKEVLRRELEKAEQEAKRSAGIISDYKQICSQLTERLEKQQAAHTEELHSLKSAVKACASCRLLAESDDSATTPNSMTLESEEDGEDAGLGSDGGATKEERGSAAQEKVSLRAQIRELEQELAHTKLQMVEAKCRIQDLEHQRGILANDLQDAKNSWISKAFTSLRTSTGAFPALALPRDGAPALGLHSGSLSVWSQRLKRIHRHNQASD